VIDGQVAGGQVIAGQVIDRQVIDGRVKHLHEPVTRAAHDLLMR